MRTARNVLLLLVALGLWMGTLATVNAACPEDDAYEPNDTVEEAAPLEAGFSLYTDLDGCYGPSYTRDWYSIVAPESGNLKVLITFNPNNEGGDLDLAIYHSSDTGSALDSTFGTGSGLNETEEVYADVTTGETYFIRVTAWDTTPYTMDLNVCTPDCAGKVCGDDGCGGSCGTCAAEESCVDFQCVSCVDGYEPNDSVAEAYDSLVVGTTYTDMQACADEDDYYLINIDAACLLTATISGYTVDLDFYLYEADGTTSIDSSTSYGTADETVRAGLDIGTYVLRAKNFDSEASTYQMVITCDVCDPDAYEPNDTFDTAYESLTLDQAYTDMKACAGEEDWYAVQVTETCLLRSTLSDVVDANIDLYLFEADGSTQLDSDLSGDPLEVVDAVGPGTYLIQVDNTSTDIISDYSLLTTCEVCQNDDINEPNDTYQDALLLDPGLTGDLVACPLEDDWWAVEALQDQVIIVSAAFSDEAGNLDLYLYSDPTGSPVDSSTSFNDNEEVVFTAPANGTYYVLVSSNEALRNTYSLNVELCVPDCASKECGRDGCGGSCGECVDPAPYCDDSFVCVADCPNDPYEPNENIDDANVLLSGGNALVIGNTYDLRICGGEEDWFPVVVDSACTLTVDMTNLEADIDLNLKDAAGDNLDTSGAGGTSSENVSALVPPGNYYIRAYGFSSAESPYTLSITCPACVPDCTDKVCGDDSCFGSCGECLSGETCIDFQCLACFDSYEINNTVETAAGPLALDTQYDDMTACPGDDDWYSIDITEACLLTTQVSNFVDADVNLYLFDTDGSTQLRSDTFGDVLEVVDAVSPGSYYIKVTNDSATAISDYSMLSTCAVCENDAANEPNDSYLDALVLDPGLTDGLIACPLEDDWWAVEALQDQVITVTATFLHADGDLELYMYSDPTGSPVDSSTSSTDNEEVSYKAPANGIYYVLVKNVDASRNTYSLNVEFCTADCSGKDCGSDGCGGVCGTCSDPTPYCSDAFICVADCPNDMYEPNEDLAGANTGLAIGGTYDLYRCEDDEDWFAIGVAETCTLSVDMTNLEADLDINLKNDQGTNLDSSVAGGSTSENVSDLVPPGTYYIRVYGFSSTSPYTLDIQCAPCVPDCTDKECGDDGCFGSCGECAEGFSCTPEGVCFSCVDPYEPNDDFASATVVDRATTEITDGYLCEDDLDGYEITLQDGETFEVTLTSDNNDIEMYIVDGSGIPLTPTGETTYTAMMGQTLYVAVLGAEVTTSGGYSLAFSYTATACVDDGQEPNDNWVNAIPISDTYSQADLHICPSNWDWYSFSAAEGDSVQVDVSFVDDNGDIDIYLYSYDPAATPSLVELESSTGFSDLESMTYTFTATDPDQAVIRVGGYPWESCDNSYDMDVVITRAGVDGDVDEEADIEEEIPVDGDEDVVDEEPDIELVCDPGATRCGDAGDVEVCADGTGWTVAADCTESQICKMTDPDVYACVDIICTPDAQFCDANGDIALCNADGTELTVVTDCTETQVCQETDPDVFACIDVICTPDAVQCNQDGDLEMCSADGTSWDLLEDCTESQVCLETEPDIFACVDVICTATELRCSASDDVEVCNGTGTAWELSVDCDDLTQICSEVAQGDFQCVAVACTAGEQRCGINGDIEVCNAEGTAWELQTDCTDGAQVCVESSPDVFECVAIVCEPADMQCDDNGDVVTCNANGTAWEVTADCGAEQICLITAESVAECLDIVCEGGATRCSNNGDVEECNNTGTAWDLQTVCADSQICKDDGAGAFICASIICSGGETQCNVDGDVETCSSDGTAWEVTSDCTDTQVCADQSGTFVCLDVICTPGATQCNDDGDVELCNPLGTGWALETDCTDTQLCKDSALGVFICADIICTADETRCSDDEDIEICSADGTAWELSVDCTDDTQVCMDADGGPACIDVVCSLDEMRCSDGGDIELCVAEGTAWQLETECADGTACEQVNPGDFQCVSLVDGDVDDEMEIEDEVEIDGDVEVDGDVVEEVEDDVEIDGDVEVDGDVVDDIDDVDVITEEEVDGDVVDDVDVITEEDVDGDVTEDVDAVDTTETPKPSGDDGGCGGCNQSNRLDMWGMVLMLAVGMVLRRRRTA